MPAESDVGHRSVRAMAPDAHQRHQAKFRRTATHDIMPTWKAKMVACGLPCRSQVMGELTTGGRALFVVA